MTTTFWAVSAAGMGLNLEDRDRVNRPDGKNNSQVRFTLTLDWSKAIAPPEIALRRLLKILLRTYQARCLQARIHPLDGDGCAAKPEGVGTSAGDDGG